MTTNEDNSGVTASQSDPVEAMRELAMRFIQPIYVRFSPSRPAGPPQLLPGRLPPSPPVEVPIPEGSRIIGTVVQDSESTTVLDAPLSADAVLAFYRERMPALGWREQEVPGRQPHGQGGFTFRRPLTIESALFFQGPRGPSLNVVAALRPQPGALTEVSLMFRIRPPDRMQGPLSQRMNGMQEMIPPLEPPEGAEQQGGGAGGGGGSWRTDAMLLTDRRLVAVAAHYDAQLAGAGWQLSRSGLTPPVAWSTWTLTDTEGEPWRGFLIIVQHPEDEHHYVLDLHVDWVGGEPDLPAGGSTQEAPLPPVT